MPLSTAPSGLTAGCRTSSSGPAVGVLPVTMPILAHFALQHLERWTVLNSLVGTRHQTVMAVMCSDLSSRPRLGAATDEPGAPGLLQPGPGPHCDRREEVRIADGYRSVAREPPRQSPAEGLVGAGPPTRDHQHAHPNRLTPVAHLVLRVTGRNVDPAGRSSSVEGRLITTSAARTASPHQTAPPSSAGVDPQSFRSRARVGRREHGATCCASSRAEVPSRCEPSSALADCTRAVRRSPRRRRTNSCTLASVPEFDFRRSPSSRHV